MQYKYEENLESERLVTKFLTNENIEDWNLFLNNSEATQYFPKNFFENVPDKSQFWIYKQLHRYANNKYGLQALYLKNTDIFIGQCGLLLQEINDTIEVEVGYHILPQFWRNGYATEAAKLFINYAKENELTNSIISIIDIENWKSQKVANKNGLKRENQVTWRDINVYVYRKEF